MVGRMIYLEDEACPGSVTGMTLCVMRRLMIIHCVSTYFTISTGTRHLHYVLLYMYMNSFLCSAPPTHLAYPFTLVASTW